MQSPLTAYLLTVAWYEHRTNWGLRGQEDLGIASLRSNQHPSNPHYISRLPAQRRKGSLFIQQEQTLPVEKCFPSTPYRRKNGRISACISQPNLLITDVKKPLVVPWYRGVGTASSDSGMRHQQVLQPLVLSSAHKDPRDSSSPFQSRRELFLKHLLYAKHLMVWSPLMPSPTDKRLAIMSLLDMVLLSSFD